MTIYRKYYKAVAITKWDCGSEYAHIRLATMSSEDPRGRDSAVVEGVTTERMIEIGKFARLLKPSIGDDQHQLSDEMSCHDFAEMIGDVRDISETAPRIAELRGQLEDLCNDEDRLPNLDDDEVAFLGWICASIWSEQASEVDNPFAEVQTIRYPMIDVLEQYCPTPPWKSERIYL